MTRWLDALGKLNPRLITGLMVFVISLLIFEGWILVLRKPFTEYQQTHVKLSALQDRLNQSPNPAGEQNLAAGELKQLTGKLSGQLRLPGSDDEVAAALLAALDQSASQYSVRLASVSPKERKRVSVFDELAFEVSASGSYLQLSNWMINFQKAMGNNASVSEFEMKTADDNAQVSVALTIAVYRPSKPSGGTP